MYLYISVCYRGWITKNQETLFVIQDDFSFIVAGGLVSVFICRSGPALVLMVGPILIQTLFTAILRTITDRTRPGSLYLPTRPALYNIKIVIVPLLSLIHSLSLSLCLFSLFLYLPVYPVHGLQK